MTTDALTHNTDTANAWAAGYGPIRHTPLTRRRVADMVAAIGERGEAGQGPAGGGILHAADPGASAALWLRVPATDARPRSPPRPGPAPGGLQPPPQGHTR